MHDFEPRSSVTRLRARLARRLALVSLVGLLALFALLLALAACGRETVDAGRSLS